jgi:hypothetical protein
VVVLDPTNNRVLATYIAGECVFQRQDS